MNQIYAWPTLIRDPDDPLEKKWATWAAAVQEELGPVYDVAFQALPEDPTLLDKTVTQFIDGWLPRVAALAVRAEFWLQAAKGVRYPQPRMGENGKPITAGERDAEFEGSLAGFRFVRNELDALVKSLTERRYWAMSVRKSQGAAQ